MLEGTGVDVRLGQAVTNCSAEGVQIGERFIASRTIVWAAGVQASPAATWLAGAADRAGRVVVGKDLTAPGLPEVFVIGDTASVVQENGKPVPGIAPAAKQQGSYVAKVIRARLAGKGSTVAVPLPASGQSGDDRPECRYRRLRQDQAEGGIAWWIWGIAHIYFLIGTRSRFAVAWSWLWIYLSGQHSARLITQKETMRDED